MILTWNNFERRVAQVLSIVFQPMFMPLLTAYLLFNSHTYIEFAASSSLKRFIYATLLLNTVVLPIIVFGVLLNRKIITTHHMDRYFPPKCNYCRYKY